MGSDCPAGVGTLHYVVRQGSSWKACLLQRGYVATKTAQQRGAQGTWGAGRETG